MTHKQRLCDELGITILQLNKFMRMVGHYVAWWVHDNNNGGNFALADNACRRATLYAQGLKLTVDWSPGLYPTIVKDGKEYHLPYRE